MLRVAVEEDARAEVALGLDEICRDGARQMLAKALELEVEAYICAFTSELDDRGHRLVVRNGHAEPRMVATGAGPIEVTVRRALAEIRDAEDRSHAEAAIKAFADGFGVKWPKAVAKVTDDRDELLAFFDFPAEHWVHLKTTNPIESTFATVRLRTKVTKGPGSKAAGLAMVFKLIEAAQDRWRAVNAPHLVALVRAGVKFEKGVMIERLTDDVQKVAA